MDASWHSSTPQLPDVPAFHIAALICMVILASSSRVGEVHVLGVHKLILPALCPTAGDIQKSSLEGIPVVATNNKFTRDLQ